MTAEAVVGRIGLLRLGHRERRTAVNPVGTIDSSTTDVAEVSPRGRATGRTVSTEKWNAMIAAMLHRQKVIYPAREAALARMSGRTIVPETTPAMAVDNNAAARKAAERARRLDVMAHQVGLAKNLAAQGAQGFPDGKGGRHFLLGEGIVVGIFPTRK